MNALPSSVCSAATKPRALPLPAGRLVLASHRMPGNAGSATASGLVSGVLDGIGTAPALWFGCESRSTVRDYEGAEGNLSLQPVQIDADLYDCYYHGFSNSVLWPAFHGMPERVRRTSDDYEAYHAVNRRFAVAMQKQLTTADRIWIHDYQLLPLGHYLRQYAENMRIGFFLHIPVPRAGDLLHEPACLELFRMLDAYDIVGVQTAGDAARLRSIQPSLSPRIVVAPVGIDTEKFNAAAANSLKRPLPETVGERLIVGVDRLDYTKGVHERLKGFNSLLDDYQRQRGVVTLVQVVAPSRRGIADYDELLQRLRAQTRSINRRWGTAAWTPLVLIEESITRDEVAGLLRHADVGLVTPLRDGMNLLAKEFVAAQNMDSPGSLVLSRQAGVAETLGAAQLVDARSPSDIAQGIQRALSLSLQQRRRDLRKMRVSLHAQSASAWHRSLLSALNAVLPRLK